MIRSSTWHAFAVAAVLAVASVAAAASKPEWKAGAAAVKITPKESIWLSGYGNRKKPSEGVALDLHAKALALEDQRGGRMVIVTTDLIGLPRAMSEAIADAARQRYRLSRGQLLLTSSHTHAGPVLRENLAVMYDLTPQQAATVQQYSQDLQERIVEVIGAALKDLAPADLSFSRGFAGFAMNRRAKREKGVVIDVNPQGPVEHEVPVLRITRAGAGGVPGSGLTGGGLRAVLLSYACHNTTLGGDFYQVHGDYAGEMQAAFEKEHPGALALFMIGCGADANPNPRGKLDLAQQHGRELAAAVHKTIAETQRPITGRLRSQFDRVDIPFAPLPTREEWQKRLSDENVFRRRHAQVMLAKLDKDGKLPATYEYPIQVVQFGNDLTLIALGGEVVVDYSLRLKRELGADKLWTVGYANDVFAYIASKRVLEEGGYEADTSMIYYGQPTRWAPEVEDTIVRKVHAMVKKN